MQPRMAVKAAQHKIINLLKSLWDFLVFINVCVFNVWPKTTLLPVWPRDTKSSDTPGRLGSRLQVVLTWWGASSHQVVAQAWGREAQGLPALHSVRKIRRMPMQEEVKERLMWLQETNSCIYSCQIFMNNFWHLFWSNGPVVYDTQNGFWKVFLHGQKQKPYLYFTICFYIFQAMSPYWYCQWQSSNFLPFYNSP